MSNINKYYKKDFVDSNKMPGSGWYLLTCDEYEPNYEMVYYNKRNAKVLSVFPNDGNDRDMTLMNIY